MRVKLKKKQQKLWLKYEIKSKKKKNFNKRVKKKK